MKPALVLTLAAVSAATAVQAARPALSVVGAWSRPAVAGTNGVGYLTIQNDGKVPDTLVRIESPVADRVDMHSVTTTGGVMRMTPIKGVVVPPGGRTIFGPDRYHLMLMGLKKPLAVGDRVPATLTFASGIRLRTEFAVAVMAPSM